MCKNLHKILFYTGLGHFRHGRFFKWPVELGRFCLVIDLNQEGSFNKWATPSSFHSPRHGKSFELNTIIECEPFSDTQKVLQFCYALATNKVCFLLLQHIYKQGSILLTPLYVPYLLTNLISFAYLVNIANISFLYFANLHFFNKCSQFCPWHVRLLLYFQLSQAWNQRTTLHNSKM